MSEPKIISGLSEIADDYDCAICDVWGVLHDGRVARDDTVEALRRFRTERGPVVLLTNAPRPVKDVEELFVKKYGIPLDCYDAIVTSGVATREALEKRTASHRLKMLHIGPERDRGVFEGLNIELVEPEFAEVALCTGLYDDETETPDNYKALNGVLLERGLTMLCANPDIVVQRDGKLIFCAGAVAREYEKEGGKAIYYGKPHLPIYETTFATLKKFGPTTKPLAIGDGLATDIMGANAAGLDALFIADGIHGEDVADFTPAHLGELFAQSGASARWAMRALAW
ncbi:MAG TPA: TIGR01459 family HAD-type hydrolase [Rhizomicrobium sp.]|jgi:HAD superfamily hydrolase (TIGR01459 family)|nr:TIGR01459 family HAD-type hydrolase [Rhizomicrobium sp.]